MKRFEYYNFKIMSPGMGDSAAKHFHDRMNALGVDGWEVIQMFLSTDKSIG